MLFKHLHNKKRAILDVPDSETMRINILSRPGSSWAPIEPAAEPVSEFNAREKALKLMTVAQLQGIAGDGEKGWKKADYVESIMRAEFPKE